MSAVCLSGHGKNFCDKNENSTFSSQTRIIFPDVFIHDPDEALIVFCRTLIGDRRKSAGGVYVRFNAYDICRFYGFFPDFHNEILL